MQGQQSHQEGHGAEVKELYVGHTVPIPVLWVSLIDCSAAPAVDKHK